MSNYDKMVAINKEQSHAKIEAAQIAMRKLVENGERVSIPKLMKITGLSRGFFYKNPTVRRELDQVIEQQVGMIDPRRSILDKAMDNQIELLKQQAQQWKQENEALKKENEELKKALNKRKLDMLKNL